MTLTDKLAALIGNKTTLNSTAFVLGDQKYSYAQLFRHAARLSMQLDTERGSPVLVCGHKEPGMLAGFLACIASGRPFVPIDQSLPAARIRQIADITAAGSVIVCNDQVAVADIPAIDGRLCRAPGSDSPDESSDDAWLDAALPALFDNAVTGLETVYIIFTSGSTGEPKGVKIPMEALDDFLSWTTDGLFPTPPARKIWLNQAIFSFDLSVLEIWTALATAGTVVALDRTRNRNIRAAFRDMSDHGVQFWVSTPSFADLCLLDRRFCTEKIPTLEVFVFCGEPLSHQTARALKARFPRARIWNLYGPTEATCATAGLEITSDILERYSTLPVGYAKPGTQITFHDGEIVISGTNVSTGYASRPKLTAQKFYEAEGVRSYRTGDIGILDAAGRLYCLGRADTQIKLNGYRIELSDIENAMRMLPGVEAAACAELHEDGKVTGIACCYCGDIHDIKQLKILLSSSLPDYMIPSHFLQQPEIPLNNNGKVNRQAVRELFT